MNTVVLVGWFLISTYGQDQTHNYLLEDRKNSVYVAVTLDKPLPYGVNTWGKFIIEAECESMVTTIEIPGGMKSIQNKFCNANKVKILDCANGAYIGGKLYC